MTLLLAFLLLTVAFAPLVLVLPLVGELVAVARPRLVVACIAQPLSLRGAISFRAPPV